MQNLIETGLGVSVTRSRLIISKSSTDEMRVNQLGAVAGKASDAVIGVLKPSETE
jgi:hypothetical protein